jgi:hypothetical protein
LLASAKRKEKRVIDKSGIYDLSMEAYQKDPCETPSLTRGMIQALISECPAKAWYGNQRLNSNYKEEVKASFDLGTVCHSLFLEGIDIAEPLDFDSWRTNASKDAAEKARENGKIPLLRENYDRAVKVVKAAEEQLAESELHIFGLRAEGFSEQSYIWQEKNGIWCRVRPDWVSSDTTILLDLKTTSQSADPSSYVRRILDGGTDIQAAFYTRGVEEIEKIAPRFIVMVVEIEEPYLCSFISLSNQFLTLGEQKVKEGMRIWTACMASGEWSGFPKRIMQVDAPPYAIAQWEERKFTAELLAQDATFGDGLPF